MTEEKDRAEAAVKACYSTWAESYFTDYYAAGAAYPPIHQKIVRDLLVASGARTLLDAGCGPASMLRNLADLGLDLYGFDLTPEMIEVARREMAKHGVDPSRLWEGSVADAAAFHAPSGGPAAFDAAICVGVLPHVPQSLDALVIANLRAAVRPGGLVAIEARNQLFALFTLNRYSRDFFLKDLIDVERLRAAAGPERAALDQAITTLDDRFRTDLPPIRRGTSGEPGYDEVLSRTHNPMELKAAVAAAGFSDVRVLFYHYHCLPPMLEAAVPGLFRAQSIAMEDPEDWRGHFMASAFIVTGHRA